MNPTILVVIGPGFLNQAPTLGFGAVPEDWSSGCIFAENGKGWARGGGGGVAKTSGDFLESGFNTGPH